MDRLIAHPTGNNIVYTRGTIVAGREYPLDGKTMHHHHVFGFKPRVAYGPFEFDGKCCVAPEPPK